METRALRAGSWGGVHAALDAALGAQAGRLFLYVPICLAIGIGSYFALLREPTRAEWVGVALVSIAFAWLGWRARYGFGPVALAFALAGSGMLVAGARAYHVAAPVLDLRFFGAIEGRIVKVDRAASDAVRLTLDQVALEGVAQARTPEHVRITLHGAQDFIMPLPGLRVMTTGHLGPPPAPAEPGGFDFRRLAWFERLGAVGYTRVPVLAAPPQQGDARGMALGQLRMTISRAVQDRLPGDEGGFAAAILTGDRSGISAQRTEELRRSNLAHLLAISGLHMGLLTACVFGLLRFGLALVPPLVLRWPTRKIAALGALAAGAFYLALSGGNVATERAYIMVAVMFVAVLADRRAISLRSVALAATVILLLRPEALLQAGFQMSFAATIALVAVFRMLADDRRWKSRLPRWALPVLSVVICSVVAGIATAPVAAASFNRLAEYGLLANLATVPLMGLVIMPAAVLAALLVPFGLESWGLALMGPAIGWILHVSAWVSGLEGAVTPIAEPPWLVMPLMALGALWMILWRGPARWAGMFVMGIALGLWVTAKRPALLVASDASVVGLMTDQGRALSQPRAGSFVAESWLRADGDAADQATAFARTGLVARERLVGLHRAGWDVVHVVGAEARDAARMAELCLPGRILVLTESHAPDLGACRLITPQSLRATGALAFDLRAGQLHERTVTGISGRRLWTGQGP